MFIKSSCNTKNLLENIRQRSQTTKVKFNDMCCLPKGESKEATPTLKDKNTWIELPNLLYSKL